MSTTTKRELGDLRPLRKLLDDLKAREAAASPPLGNQSAVEVLRVVRADLERAIAEAEHPELAEGLSVEEYAKLNGITPFGVYKRIQRGHLTNVERVPGRGYIIREDAA